MARRTIACLMAGLLSLCLSAFAGTPQDDGGRVSQEPIEHALADMHRVGSRDTDGDAGKTLADGLYMSGVWVANWSGGFVTLTLPFIRNDSFTHTTGTLRLSFWATTSYPPRAAGFSGYRLATFTSFLPLPPRMYYYDIVRSGGMSSPPNGTYWLVLALEEYAPGLCSNPDGFCLVDSLVSDTQSTFGSVTTLHSLNVHRAGTGAGTVTSSPSGINCGLTCTSQYPAGNKVTLVASPAVGSSFAGWSGACSGTSPCEVTLTAAKSVTAWFSAVPPPVEVGTLVSHYYSSILRRPADLGGRAFWESEAMRVAALGASVNEAFYAMAMSFFGSSEYAALARSDAGFITDLYTAFFNRPPDTEGLGFWASQLASGLPRDVALVSFMLSGEFTGRTQAMFGNTAARAEIDTVVDFYRGLLSRLPDNSGFNHWARQFRTAQCLGSTAVYSQVEAISSAFIGSPEYAARFRTNAQYVGDLYNAFLRRGGDLGGVLYWINQLDSGAMTRSQLRQAFLASPEFSGRVNAIIAQGCLP